MRLRAGLGLLCVGLAGCQHLPAGVKVDLPNRVVEVGPCRCRLPVPGQPVEAERPVDEERGEAPVAQEAPGDAPR
jgi:hypothetical protein